ncbi:hypothetical protein [Rhodocista pekingensis]|uniref:GGDEF domain-containing protein n=1 Tax=Rhodocista pekingensis TaxID=201185 RepID=A0ABW2L0K0_9PROT
MPYGVLTPFVRRFTAWLEDVLGTEAAGDERHPDEHLWTSAALRRRLRDFIEEHPQASAACLNLIGLDVLKAHLGPRWPAAAARVQMLAEHMLVELSGPDDLWFRFEDDHYIVVFAHLDKAEAQARCARFIARLNALLLGTPDLTGLVFETVLIDARSLAVERVPLHSMMDETAPASRVPPAAASPAATPGLPAAQIPAAQAPAGEVPTGSGGLGSGGAPGPLAGAAVPQPGGAGEARPVPGAPQPSSLPVPPPIELRYEPVWDVRAGAVTTYLARAVREGSGGMHGVGYEVLSDHRPDSIASLDGLVLMEARSVLAELFENRFRLLISVPVHVETLAQAGRRSAYMDICRETPRHLTPFILFWLHGLGPGVPAGRLAELVGMLKPFSRAVLAHLDLGQIDPAPLVTGGLSMVGMDLPLPVQTPARLPEVLRLLAALNRRGLHLYAGGVRHGETALALARAGVDYIYGPAVGPLRATPEHMLRFSESDLHA